MNTSILLQRRNESLVGFICAVTWEITLQNPISMGAVRSKAQILLSQECRLISLPTASRLMGLSHLHGFESSHTAQRQVATVAHQYHLVAANRPTAKDSAELKATTTYCESNTAVNHVDYGLAKQDGNKSVLISL